MVQIIPNIIKLHSTNHRYMMQYLAWRVLVGLNKAITISFLVVGHTKFAPDWCFGLLKQKFRKSKVDCLADLVQVVQASAEVNHAQLVGNENGDVIVPTYDWADHFDVPFRQTALKGIKSFHHFTFNASQPGEVAVQTVCDGPKKHLKLLSDPAWRPQRTDLPPIIKPNGLTLERQCYLYEKIREFCQPDVRDIVCPRPEGMEPAPPAPVALPTEPGHPPPAKKPRHCGNCHEPGHNRRSCPLSK